MGGEVSRILLGHISTADPMSERQLQVLSAVHFIIDFVTP